MKLKKHMSVLLSILLSFSGNSIFALDSEGIVDNNNGESTPKFNSKEKDMDSETSENSLNVTESEIEFGLKIIESMPKKGDPDFENFLKLPNQNKLNEARKITVNYKGVIHMNENVPDEKYFEEMRFKTISDFKWAMEYNSEVEFEWNEKVYSITHPDGIISICEGNKYSEAKDYKTVDEALEYVIDGQKLREIITKVKVWSRAI